MGTQIEFTSAGEKLIGRLCKAHEGKAALLICAGGAGIPHGKGWYPHLQRVLSEKGISSFVFDYRGVGESANSLSETSILSRIADARCALEVLRTQIEAEYVYVMGQSMGGPIALAIASTDITGLILLVPAAYSEVARVKFFGEEFSNEIRKQESWKDTPEFSRVESFSGRILLAYGSKDEVIPEAIYNTYTEIVSRKHGQVYVYESMGHKFMRETDPISAEARKYLENLLTTFILNK